jgi:ribonuclease D
VTDAVAVTTTAADRVVTAADTVPRVIAQPEPLRAACEAWRERPWLALDTEFVRESTYYPQLCLVQVSDGRSSTCIDTLALDPESLRPLLETVYGSGIKVFHAASQDLEILLQLGGAVPQPLFDTQLAAALLGIGDQLGYAALVENMLGLRLDKSLTRTDWSRRPLSAAELAYAAADVRYLAEIYPRLRERLEQAGRLAWLQEDCQRMADPARYQSPPATAWRRLKGMARLAPAEQRVAAAIAAWREETAQARNRPRKWILDDEPLYRLAERQPPGLEQLEGLQLLPPKLVQRHGAALVERIAAAAASTEPALLDEAPLVDAQKAQLRQLVERVRDIAGQLHIPASLLGPRGDLEALVRSRDAAGVPLLAGWRREVAGDELLRLLG